MPNMRYKSWMDDVHEYFSDNHRTEFYRKNPILGLSCIIGWTPHWIATGVDTECQDEAYLLTQIALFSEGRMCTYRHIVCSQPQGEDRSLVAVDVPLWRDVDECNRQLLLIREKEKAILAERKKCGLRLPRRSFLQTYLSLVATDHDNDGILDDCVYMGDGDVISALVCRLEEIVERRHVDAPLWANGCAPVERIMAINILINQYWLTHLLCGFHAQYESMDQLQKATIASLYGMPSLLCGVEDVPREPTLHVVYVRTLPGVNRALSYVNEAVMEMCGKGSVSHPRIGKAYWWKIQQVDSKGTALMLHGKIMQISDVQVEKHPVLGHVRRILERLTVCLPHDNAPSHGPRSMPLVAVVPVQCAAPTGDCQIVDINDPSLRVDDLPVSAYVIRKFGFDRGD